MLKSHLYQNPNPNFSITTSTCVGTTITPTNSSTSSTSYTWNFPGGFPSSSTLALPSVSYSLPGTYTINLIAGNNTTTTAIQSKTLFISGASISTSFTNASCGTCNNGSINANVSGGVSPYTYTWVPTGGNNSNAVNLLPGCYTVNVTDANNCQSSNSVCINGTPTTIQNKSNTSLIQVYPNPSNNEIIFNLNSNDLIEIKIINTIGSVVSTESIYNNQNLQRINISNLKNGYYFLQINTKTKHYQSSFIKN